MILLLRLEIFVSRPSQLVAILQTLPDRGGEGRVPAKASLAHPRAIRFAIEVVCCICQVRRDEFVLFSPESIACALDILFQYDKLQ